MILYSNCNVSDRHSALVTNRLSPRLGRLWVLPKYYYSWLPAECKAPWEQDLELGGGRGSCPEGSRVFIKLTSSGPCVPGKPTVGPDIYHLIKALERYFCCCCKGSCTIIHSWLNHRSCCHSNPPSLPNSACVQNVLGPSQARLSLAADSPLPQEFMMILIIMRVLIPAYGRPTLWQYLWLLQQQCNMGIITLSSFTQVNWDSEKWIVLTQIIQVITDGAHIQIKVVQMPKSFHFVALFLTARKCTPST